MRCPFCSKDTKVIETRESEEEVTRRRRECLGCKKRFTTYEKPEINLMVIKKDGRREPFIREKLKSGIVKACQKRPVSSEQIERAVDEIELELRNQETNEIETKFIGKLVMAKLKKLDKVAYIRFASVYKEFADLEDFEKELQKMIRK